MALEFILIGLILAMYLIGYRIWNTELRKRNLPLLNGRTIDSYQWTKTKTGEVDWRYSQQEQNAHFSPRVS